MMWRNCVLTRTILLVAVTLSANGQRQSTKRCVSGQVVRCMVSPCRIAKCEAFPNAECRDSYCDGCNAEFYIGSTEVTSQCDPLGSLTGGGKPVDGSNCPGGRVNCFADPCVVTRCPSRPSATCKADNCNCKAHFYEGDTEVSNMCDNGDSGLSKDTRPLQKVSIQSQKPCNQRRMTCSMAPCSTATCERFPNAQCRNNYCGGCNAEFWNGLREVTSECSAEELGLSRTVSIQSQKPCNQRRMTCSMAPCSTATCERFPNAQCRNNYCGGCNAEFWNGLREVTSECSGQELGQIRKPTVSIQSQKPCNQRRMTCSMAPCSTATCERFPNAQCRNNYCGGCNAEFWNGLREVTSECSAEELGLSRTVSIQSQKPCNQRRMTCSMAPCTTATCERFPNAQCRNNYCGGCNAEFWNGLREVTSECSAPELSLNRRAGIQSRKRCGSGQRRVSCQLAPCSSARCDGFPNAQCRNNYCGGCNAEFWDGNREVTSECSADNLGLSVQRTNTGTPANSCPNTCLFNPCLFSYCARFPQAECRYDTCKGCVAQFVLNQEDVTTRCRERAPGFAGLFSRFRRPRTRPTYNPWLAFLNGLF